MFREIFYLFDYPPWTLLSGLVVLLIATYLMFFDKRDERKPPMANTVKLAISFFRHRLNLHKAFAELSKSCGPIFSINLFPEEWTILNDYDSIHEAFVRNGTIFSGRPNLHVTTKLSEGLGLILVDYGEHWKSQRMFGLTTLKRFGLGKSNMENKIKQEAKYLVEAIKARNEKPFNCQTTMIYAVSNIICGITIGRRFQYSEKVFQDLIMRLNRSFSSKVDTFLLSVMTVVSNARLLPFFRGAYKRQFEDLDYIFMTLREFIEEHKKTFNPDNIRDFIDAFLYEMENNTDERSSFTERQLFHYVRDMFVAGSETTSSTLRWCILVLLHRPDCQKKIAKEIDDVIGNAEPTMEHRKDMPYTCAFLHEITRHRPMLPLAAPHKATADVTLKGHLIRKDTAIMANVWAVHYDSNHFENPKELNPERFFDSEGKFVANSHVIPFSIGPRKCIGSSLVKMELFLFLTNILKTFTVLPDPTRKPPSYHDGIQGFTYVPHPYVAVFQCRNTDA